MEFPAMLGRPNLQKINRFSLDDSIFSLSLKEPWLLIIWQVPCITFLGLTPCLAQRFRSTLESNWTIDFHHLALVFIPIGEQKSATPLYRCS